MNKYRDERTGQRTLVVRRTIHVAIIKQYTKCDLSTVKILKIGTPKIITVIVLQMEYSRPSLSRLRLSRITAYLEEKI